MTTYYNITHPDIDNFLFVSMTTYYNITHRDVDNIDFFPFVLRLLGSNLIVSSRPFWRLCLFLDDDLLWLLILTFELLSLLWLTVSWSSRPRNEKKTKVWNTCILFVSRWKYRSSTVFWGHDLCTWFLLWLKCLYESLVSG